MAPPGSLVEGSPQIEDRENWAAAGGAGKSAPEGGAGKGGRGRGRGAAAGRGRGRRAAHFLLGAGQAETKRQQSASGFGNLPALAELAAGNCFRAGAGSPAGPRGSSGGRAGRGHPHDPARNRAPGGRWCGLRPASPAAPRAWALAGRGRRFLTLGKLRGRGGWSRASRRPRAAAALPRLKVSPGF